MKEKKEYVGFLTIDYEDGDASTYKGIKLSFGDDDYKLFNVGDPLIDWYDFCLYVYNGEAFEKGVSHIAHSSNVDHWFMDTDEYKEKYLILIDDEHYDFMTYEDINKLSISDINKYQKCVIKNDMKSFQELKDYYYSYKK